MKEGFKKIDDQIDGIQMNNINKYTEEFFSKLKKDGVFKGEIKVFIETNKGPHTEIYKLEDDLGSKTLVPPDLINHLPELMNERDFLLEVSFKGDEEEQGDIERSIKLKHACMQLAIYRIRKKYNIQIPIEHFYNGYLNTSQFGEDIKEHTQELMRERDRLSIERFEPWFQECTEIAILNIRNKYKTEGGINEQSDINAGKNGDTSESSQKGSPAGPIETEGCRFRRD